MCNLYHHAGTQDELRRLFEGVGLADRTGNLAPGDIHPDRLAPIVRHAAEGLELAQARWGMPSPPQYLKTARDPGITNVRNAASAHWSRWMGPAHRCLVPLTAFAESLGRGRGYQWFGPADPATRMFFAGIETRGWRSVRKVQDGETEDDLFAFLTTEPNAEVKPVHPKAMPVILTRPEEWETWLAAPAAVALRLQRPLPDGTLARIEAPG